MFLERFRKESKVDDYAETLFVVGCYVVQVMVVNANGNWVKNQEYVYPKSLVPTFHSFLEPIDHILGVITVWAKP